jgi:hypothetical protein
MKYSSEVSWGSSVSVAITLPAAPLKAGSSFACRDKGLSFHQRTQLSCASQAAFYSMDTGISPRCLSSRCVKPIKHSHITSRLRMRGAIPTFHRILQGTQTDNFIFTFLLNLKDEPQMVTTPVLLSRC